ncbi:aromatic prenyltransferase [Ilyonectria sp. MPI-CAGE-AT-0026]|nr:aromatic prenyltransferase [Ilyonectria sp. MPI-CAGE-AT-0026]
MNRPGYLSGDAKPWHLVKARADGLLSSQQQYWYQAVGYVLAALVDSAGYSHPRQVSILNHFASLVTPYLGVAPWSDLPRWKSFMTDDHTPVELSWDFHTGIEQPTIRYSIEPIGLDAGTVANRRNDRAAADFKQGLVKAFPDTDTAWLDHFEACFNVCPTDGVSEGHRSTMFWAFDLTEQAITNKAYFFPGAVAYARNRSKLAVIEDAITSAPGYSSENLMSFNAFTDYVGQHLDVKLEVDMLALDLVPVDKSRLKIYFRDRRTDFRAVHENMSLGGRIKDPDFEMGMQRLRRLWDALLNTRDTPDNVPLPHKDHRTAGILYNVEFRMHAKVPVVKVYIPVRHYAKNDQQIISALTGFLTEKVGKQRGLAVAPVNHEVYSRCLQNIL